MAGKSDIDQLKTIQDQVYDVSIDIEQLQGDLIKKAAELRQDSTMLYTGKVKSDEGQRMLEVTGKKLKNHLSDNEVNKNKLKTKQDTSDSNEDVQQQQSSTTKRKGM